jgi:hypothetical protein
VETSGRIVGNGAHPEGVLEQPLLGLFWHPSGVRPAFDAAGGLRKLRPPATFWQPSRVAMIHRTNSHGGCIKMRPCL